MKSNKKDCKTITDSDWWDKKSNNQGLPKGHPFLDRENRSEEYGGKKNTIKINDDLDKNEVDQPTLDEDKE